MTDASDKAPWHLWLVGVVAVLFNTVGAFDYTMSMMQGAEYMARAGITPEQIAFIQDYPMWMKIVWPTGVWTAFAGSLLILARKKAAFPLFALSLAAFLLNLLYLYVLSAGAEVIGSSMAGINAVITAELAFLIWYSREMTKRSILR